MTAAAHVRSSANTLWSRLLARFRFARDLTRPRVPLVLRRSGASPMGRPAADRSPRAGPQYHLALHVQLSWPQWLVRQQHVHMSSAHTVLSRSLVRRLTTRAVTVGAPPVAREKGVDALSTGLQRAAVALAPAAVGGVQVPARREHQTTLQRIASRRSDLVSPRQPIARRAFDAAPMERAGRHGARIVGRSPDLPPDHQVEPERARTAVDTTLMTSVRRRVQAWSTQAETRSTRLATRPTPRRHPVADRSETDGAVHVRAASGSGPATLARTPLRTRARAVESVSDTRSLRGATPFGHATTTANVHATAEPPQQPAAIARTATARRPEPAAPLNIERLSDEVYRHIQKRMRIERERRGL